MTLPDHQVLQGENTESQGLPNPGSPCFLIKTVILFKDCSNRPGSRTPGYLFTQVNWDITELFLNLALWTKDNDHVPF